MAKESMKAREVKRAKLVARYAEKRAALKQIVRTGEPADAFEAAQKFRTDGYNLLDDQSVCNGCAYELDLNS